MVVALGEEKTTVFLERQFQTHQGTRKTSSSKLYLSDKHTLLSNCEASQAGEPWKVRSPTCPQSNLKKKIFLKLVLDHVSALLK